MRISLHKNKRLIAAIALILLIGLTGLQGQDQRTLKTKVADLLAKYPAVNAAENAKLAEELTELGENGILQACQLLTAAGVGDDARIRFALHGLTTHSIRPGAEDQRQMVSGALVGALKQVSDKEAKAFIISQLQICGKEEAAIPLSEYIQDGELYEPAIRALLAIETESVKQLLFAALPGASGKSRISIIRALGVLRCQAAVPALKKLYKNKSRDENVRLVTLFALSNIAEAKSSRILAKAARSQSRSFRNQAAALYLNFIRRRIKDDPAKWTKVLRKLIKSRVGSNEPHVMAAALEILVSTHKVGALGDLIEAVDSPFQSYRQSALQLALTLKGTQITEKWIGLLARSSQQQKVELIDMLGSRLDPLALPPVLEALKDDDQAVRLAAITAAARLGGDQSIRPLIGLLKKADESEVDLIKRTLLSISGSALTASVAEVTSELPPLARAAMVDVLAQRRATDYLGVVLDQTASADDLIRLSAIKALKFLADEKQLGRAIDLLIQAGSDAEVTAAQDTVVELASKISESEERGKTLLTKIAEITGNKRADLLKPLARLGGKSALETVVENLGNSNPVIREAAVETLGNWLDLSAIEPLLKLSETSSDTRYQSIAIKGYTRLVSQADLSWSRQLQLNKKIMASARSVADKKLILAAVSGIKSRDALDMIVEYLDDENLKSDAATAAISIALPHSGNTVGLLGRGVKTILKRANPLIDDTYVQARVDKYLKGMPARAPFIPLFNGKDLSGWKGLVGNPASRMRMTPHELVLAQKEADELMRKHWKVKDGALVFDGKGHSLVTSREFRDFEMTVDWKIEKGGDSGIYLRGSPQVQIWDASQWPKKNPGSGGLYNNQKNPSHPLVPGDNPVGEWNTFRIKMIGERVTIHLNGKLVADNVLMENYWERDKPIYSLEQIELQAHNTLLYFKNITIREIYPDEEAVPTAEQDFSEGFSPLFNGNDLAGWTGNTTGYVAENGKIVLYPKKGGGNLYTVEEFADFILRFEFKLTPGANNGLGIRAPLKGDAAYVGMELQILDNTAQIYKDLKNYQYHGSIYGVVAAKRGHLNPVGAWNYQEVIVKDSHVTVILNGVTIVEADIEAASKNGTIDGREHPGLLREKGHIGFLGHGSVVEFRNIRLKKLK